MPVRARLAVCAAVVAVAACWAAGGATAAELRTVGSFTAPVFVTAPLHEDHLLFVVERAGRVRVLRDGTVLAQPFLDISGSVSTDGEAGLLSIAFPPRYWQTGRFVVYYVDLGGSIQIVEYRRSASNAEVADPLSARTILTIPHPGATNHYGGSTAFGPDGLLYIGTGDGGGAGDPIGNAQNLGSLLGKLLRIDPFGGAPYAIPAGNPFVGVPGARPEIFAYGLRNPWRFSFDRATADLAIGDVGQGQREEVDAVPAPVPGGLNFGWNVYEGSLVFGPGSARGAIFPALEYPHVGSACAITGGVVVRDPALPSLAGRYLYGDWCVGEIHSVTLAGGTASGDVDSGLNVPQLVSFGEDAGACVYAVGLGGVVYRLAEPGAAAPVPCRDTPPQTTVTSAPASSSASSVAFGFTSSEAGSSFECRIDAGAWSACTSPTGYALSIGPHVFEVRATDIGGMTDPTPAQASVTVTAPPAGAGGGGGGGSAAAPNMTVSISAKSTAVAAGADDDIAVVVGNKGAGGTARATLAITLPTVAALLGPPAVDRGPGCTGTTTLVCDLDFFSGGLTSVVRFSIRVSGVGSQTLAAEITPAEPDADSGDNKATLTLQLTSAPTAAPAAPAPKRMSKGVIRTGAAKADTLIGTARNDTLRGRGGNDTLRGRGGNDLLVGGRGKDRLYGGAANDRLEARDGERDLVDCGPGRDVAIVDRRDRVRSCEKVARAPSQRAARDGRR